MSPYGQSKRHSFLEASINIMVGFGIALLTQLLVFPWFGIDIEYDSHVFITSIFTFVSFARSYFLRRFFNYLHYKDIL